MFQQLEDAERIFKLNRDCTMDPCPKLYLKGPLKGSVSPRNSSMRPKIW